MDVTMEELKAQSKEKREIRNVSESELALLLEEHQAWLESDGEEPSQLSLCRANLAGADLGAANLENASLPEVNLRGADLLLADLRGSCLIQANLQDTNLSGARLQGSNLQCANLRGATGLLMEQLAGTNLFAAVLPEALTKSEDTGAIDRIFRKGRWLFATMLSSCFLSWLMIAYTRDAQLIKDSPALPFLRFGGLLPTVESYLVAPIVLLGFYIYFHCHMQRLWQGLAALPAISPDGRRLDEIGPWFATALARKYMKWFIGVRPPLVVLETALATFLLYWVVPGTLLLFWARYLTTQDLRGAILQAVLVTAATALAAFLSRVARKTLCPEYWWPPRGDYDARRIQPMIRMGALALAVGFVVALLSAGTIGGVPHNTSRAPQLSTANYRRWAANLFWLVGYNPFADLNEAVVSTPPANWKGQDEELAEVKGPRLNRLSLRYSEGYRAFFANARLWQADFQGAYLSEADLRGANLRETDFRDAVLDRALLSHADLEKSELTKVNLAGADLRQTNLSFASLGRAMLADVRLDGANLYSADLTATVLARATLEKADLRDANLENANLTLADLQEADLWSAKLPGARLQNAHLGRAILIQADLRRADFSGADFQGAILRGADLSGANLNGADLRNALGANSAQVCSASSRRDVQLDDGLKLQTDAMCGNSH